MYLSSTMTLPKSKGLTMNKDIKLSNGRIVSHKLIKDNAQEAFMADGGEMSDREWEEYVQLTLPKPKEKLTWAQIKAMK